MRDLKIYIFIATGLLVVYLVAQYNRPTPVNWSETLADNDKIPFGTYILYHRLNDIFPDAKVKVYREPAYNVLTDTSLKTGTYLIVSGSLELNEYDYAKLTGFIRQGNDVFIASSYFGAQFKKNLKIETSSELSTNKTAVSSRFFTSSVDSNKKYSSDKGMMDGYFSKLDTLKAMVLAKNNSGNSNYVKYKIGKGSLYLNANPEMFSNYSLLKTSGLAYAAIALSYLKNDKNLLWDEFYTQGREGDDNSMRVFLRNAPLKWAFYVSFFSLVAFILYDMKRRQRIIPVIEPLGNSTLEFVNVVGQVYYEQRDNSNIAHKKILYLLEHLRDRYNIKTSQLDEEFIDAISGKLGLEKSFAADFTNYIKSIAGETKITDTELIQLNKLIEQLYTQSR